MEPKNPDFWQDIISWAIIIVTTAIPIAFLVRYFRSERRREQEQLAEDKRACSDDDVNYEIVD
jgi:hypothetical protein